MYVHGFGIFYFNCIKENVTDGSGCILLPYMWEKVEQLTHIMVQW